MRLIKNLIFSSGGRVIKGLIIFLSLGFIAGCTQVPHVKEPQEIVIETENLHLASLEQDRILDILEREDPSLDLYRDPAVHDLVTKFFVELTGSEKISRPILYYADRHDISLFLAFSVAYIESDFDPHAVNRNASSVDRGVFQLNSKSFPTLQEKEFFDPEISAKYGIAHLRFCLEEGKNDIVAVAIYNAGKQRVTSRGAPLMTLEYISRYVDYRSKLEKSFKTYIREATREQSSLLGRLRRPAKALIDIKKRAK